MIDWPHDSSRPEPPRGLLIRTTKPAAAWNWASSKYVSPYCVCGPPWTLRIAGYVAVGSNPAGRMIHASISAVPSVRRHDEPLPGERLDQFAVALGEVGQPAQVAAGVEDEHVGDLVDGGDGERDRAAAGVERLDGDRTRTSAAPAPPPRW